MKPLFLAACLAALAMPAAAHDFKVGALEIKHPWSRVAPPVAPVLGGYVTITNTGAESDRLVGGSAEIARFELHTSVIENGVARMRPVVGGLEIKAGETLTLQPGGAHIMFVQPERRPKEGEKFAGTLMFEKAGEVKVEFAVQKGVPDTPASAEHQGHGSAQ